MSYSLFGDKQCFPYLFVLPTLGNQSDDISLAGGEGCNLGCLGISVDDVRLRNHGGHHGAGEPYLTAMYLSNCCKEAARRFRFEENAHGSEAHGAKMQFRIRNPRQNQNARSFCGLDQIGKEIETVFVAKCNIE